MSQLRDNRPPQRPRLVVSNPGVQLPLPLVDAALADARQLLLVARIVGPETEAVALHLIETLAGPTRPRRAA